MAEHPALVALRGAHAALDALTVTGADGRPEGWVSLSGMTPFELGEAVRLQAGLEGRVAGLRLHTVAAAEAGGAVAESAAADTSSWVARAGRNRARAWGGVWLAGLLEERYPHTRAALAAGRISEEHAAVIVRAAESVPEGVTGEDLAACEERLVGKAERMAPHRLRRAARRLLEPLSKRLADQHEGELLVEEEARAERETFLWLGENGDGTWSGRFTVPELHGQLLATVLERLSGPRRHGRARTGEPVTDPTVPGAGERLSHVEALGAAFIELIEHLPATGHTRSGVSVVVHVEEAALRSGIGAATVESGGRLSAAQVRRLACEAGILPLVMGSPSVPLDLGTTTRLFTRAQAVALSAVHDSCAAEGCERPFAWCELHHRTPWSQRGPTDLDNAAPLCGWHHRRVHDPHYEHRWTAQGTVRFRHRWPSRWKERTDPWATSTPAPAASPASAA